MVAAGSAIITVLVVGATGNTGKHVVRQLLDQGHRVKVIVRSRQRMIDALPQSTSPAEPSSKYDDTNLIITEASLLEMGDADLKEHVDDADAVVSCLGHTMDFNGMFGHPRRLVTDAAKNLTQAMMKSALGSENEHGIKKKKKFILMSSDGVVDLDGKDDKRSYFEQFLFFLIRNLLPPHADNEDAAAAVHSLGIESSIEWMVIRPATLVEGNCTDYKILETPGSALFGTGRVTRPNVARAIVDFITNEDLWERWKFQFPVVHDSEKTAATPTEEL